MATWLRALRIVAISEDGSESVFVVYVMKLPHSLPLCLTSDEADRRARHCKDLLAALDALGVCGRTRWNIVERLADVVFWLLTKERAQDQVDRQRVEVRFKWQEPAADKGRSLSAVACNSQVATLPPRAVSKYNKLK